MACPAYIGVRAVTLFTLTLINGSTVLRGMLREYFLIAKRLSKLLEIGVMLVRYGKLPNSSFRATNVRRRGHGTRNFAQHFPITPRGGNHPQISRSATAPVPPCVGFGNTYYPQSNRTAFIFARYVCFYCSTLNCSCAFDRVATAAWGDRQVVGEDGGCGVRQGHAAEQSIPTHGQGETRPLDWLVGLKVNVRSTQTERDLRCLFRVQIVHELVLPGLILSCSTRTLLKGMTAALGPPTWFQSSSPRDGMSRIG